MIETIQANMKKDRSRNNAAHLPAETREDWLFRTLSDYFLEVVAG
jgi:hypothetical protein